MSRIVSIEFIKDNLDLNKIYDENISIEDVIKTKVRIYNFNPSKLEKYIDRYYLAAYHFINNTKYITPKALFMKFIDGVYVDGFKEWLISEVHEEVFQETYEIGVLYKKQKK